MKLKENYEYEDLLAIMEILRGENGCMWDKEQNHKSIRRNFIEETYEVIEAIDNDDSDLLREELGDVLLQVVFHAQMEKEAGRFSMPDVCDGICKKLIYRHPHIFSDTRVESSGEILNNWDALKKKEKGHTNTTDALESVCKSLPALIYAEKLGSKAAKIGFDFPDALAALTKLEEEVLELKQAILEDSNKAEELGDVLFSAVNIARQLKIDPENALHAAGRKFITRFAAMESANNRIEELSLTQMDTLWEASKNKNI